MDPEEVRFNPCQTFRPLPPIWVQEPFGLNFFAVNVLTTLTSYLYLVQRPDLFQLRLQLDMSTKEWQDRIRDVGYDIKRVSDNVQYTILVISVIMLTFRMKITLPKMFFKWTFPGLFFFIFVFSKTYLAQEVWGGCGERIRCQHLSKVPLEGMQVPDRLQLNFVLLNNSTIHCEKYRSNNRCRDLNSKPLEHESVILPQYQGQSYIQNFRRTLFCARF